MVLPRHHQIRWMHHPDSEELQKLMVLKEELGELSAAGEKRFRSLKANTERTRCRRKGRAARPAIFNDCKYLLRTDHCASIRSMQERVNRHCMPA